MVKKTDKIFVAGHKGLIGSAILRKLKSYGYKRIITIDKKKLNLLDQKKVYKFLKKKKPDIVIIAAAKVGGVLNNSRYGADFIYENIQIQTNLIHASFLNNIKKLIFLGSSCIYPRLWNKPFEETDLNLANLEKTNEPYAIAKISGLKLCETFNKQFNGKLPKFLTIIPPNLFGPNDNFDERNSHVLAALMRKFYFAKKNNQNKIEIWGSGRPKREFLYSICAADIIIDLIETSEKRIYKFTKGIYSHINIGSGIDYKISEIFKKLIKISKYNGKIVYNRKFPDGVKRKLLNINLLKNISPKSFLRIQQNVKEFDQNLKKEYEKITKKTFKKFKKNSTFNLSI